MASKSSSSTRPNGESDLPVNDLAAGDVPGFDAMARACTHLLRVPYLALALDAGAVFWFDANAARRPSASGRRATRSTYEIPVHPLVQELLARARQQSSAWELPDLDASEEWRQLAGVRGPPARLKFFASHAIYDSEGQHIGVLCVFARHARAGLSAQQRDALRDAAALAGHQISLRNYLARIDAVTHLPSREAFFQDLPRYLSLSDRRALLVVIEVAPVDRFNTLIRALGYRYADALIQGIACRLLAFARSDHRVYQIASTRFAILVSSACEQNLVERLDQLVTLLREPVVCNDIPLSLQPGVGLLEIGPEDLTEREILRRAMSASYAAMRKPRGWLRYDASYDELQRREFFLITELAIAVRAGTDLALHYQPRIELEGGICVGFEALIRWRHPTEGWILPATFIPLAERSGLIRILTNWVLDTAARQLAAWRDTPQASLRIGVNIASADLDFDLIRRVLQVSEQRCIDPGSLEVEFTETTLLEYGLDTQTHLATLRGLGVGIAIDDFGTGFSNLAMLRQMSADTLKIDQSFVRQMCESAQDQIIVKAICEIARDMKFRVVAEGVETADVLEALKGMACDEIQGYLLAKPMPADELLPWLARHEPARWKR